MIESHPLQPFRLARWAGALVLVVLAHIAFMATPLHAAAMHRPGDLTHGAEVGAVDEPFGDAALELGHGDGHCAIRWSLPSAPWAFQALDELVYGARAMALSGEPAALGSAPRAIGPPRLVALQVLLQVFRI